MRKNTIIGRQSGVVILLLILNVMVFSGCASKQVVPETRYVVVDRPAEIPPGVARYCWEEPLVEYERNGPGLDAEGEWYHPYYVAVREVRQGRWRPCKSVGSEVKGETKNER
jgi:hypothetical protein